jgi:small subunit ribosomal protein S6e
MVQFMQQQLNISDPETGLAYKKMNETEAAMKHLIGKKLGEEIQGDPLGFDGYVFSVRGGSDKDGFPMSSSLQGGIRRKVLTSGGIGFHPSRERRGIRKKKRIRGNIVTEDIYQINLVIIKKGDKKIEEILASEQQ